MKLSSQVKPISYLKAHAARVVDELTEQRAPLFVTQNGEAKLVVMDIKTYEQNQETFALLKLLALGNHDVAAGRVTSATHVAARLRKRIAAQ